MQFNLIESKIYRYPAYDELYKINKDHNKETKTLNQRTRALQQKTSDDERKLNELDEYDRGRNLEFQGVPAKAIEDVTEVA